jgi:hypothetical protein
VSTRFCDRQTDGQTESTKTICLPQDGGRHNKHERDRKYHENDKYLVLRPIQGSIVSDCLEKNIYSGIESKVVLNVR